MVGRRHVGARKQTFRRGVHAPGFGKTGNGPASGHGHDDDNMKPHWTAIATLLAGLATGPAWAQSSQVTRLPPVSEAADAPPIASDEEADEVQRPLEPVILLPDGVEQPIAPPIAELHAPPPETLPAPTFPDPPPPPGDEGEPEDALPPLDEELWLHGGSYLYTPEGDRLNWPECGHYQVLRLPECWQKPRPLTAFADFVGPDPIRPWPGAQWFGHHGYQWEPRFVGYGSYELFGIAFEQDGQRRDLVGHQLIAELDLQLTGTERVHVQFRPLGEDNTGGSYYQANSPSGYVDNSTGLPQRYWVEGELASVLGNWINPFAVRDYHVTLGKVPFALHNALLINDETLGVIVNKNTLMPGPLSNLNVALFAMPDDVDAFDDGAADLYGVHVTADYRGALAEASYARLMHAHDSGRDADFAAFSYTRFFGTTSLAGRVLLKWGDSSGRGDGQLYVLESNHTRVFTGELAHAAGIEYGVFYANAFRSTTGWNSISGGNFNRLRSAFAVDPLVTISANPPGDNYGVGLGVQLFRHHEDESIIPEVAFEHPVGAAAWGIGLRYLRKTGCRTYLEVLGVRTWSDDERFEREGVFASHFFVF